MRVLLILAALSLPTAIQAQSLDGSLFGGVQGGLPSGLGGGLGSGGLDGGLGSRQQGRTRALVEDFTLDSVGGFSRGALLGQPSNYGPTILSTGPLAGSTLDPGSGPAEPLSIGDGPAGPLD